MLKILPMTEHINSLDKYQEYLQQNPFVVVKFGAVWCAPCHRLLPVFIYLAEKCSAELKFISVDVDEASEIADYLNITSLPFIMFYKHNKSVDHLSISGYSSEKLKNNVSYFYNEAIISSSGYEPSSDENSSGSSDNFDDTTSDGEIIECTIVGENTLQSCDCESCLFESRSA
jgi:thioredoxin-like negative regulator of GroEL